jgi:hypothetical protein
MQKAKEKKKFRIDEAALTLTAVRRDHSSHVAAAPPKPVSTGKLEKRGDR